MKFPRPVVFVSKCLGFEACRYNRQVINDRFVDRLKKFADIVTECPEVEIGLGVPRQPIRVIEEDGAKFLYQPSSEKDVTSEMKKFIADFMARGLDIDGFILKSRSPSCGPLNVKVYQGRHKEARSKAGSGFFGEAVLKEYPGSTVEEEGRLNNFTIR
ncbi:MAG: DUF523 domain-containing protein, partial [Fibrobacterota bacterium]